LRRARRPQQEAIRAEGVPVEAGPPQIEATLITPRGQVVLTSKSR
jgi:hypothetical protein